MLHARPLTIRPYIDATDRAPMIALYRAAWHDAYDAIDGAEAIDRLIDALLAGEPPPMFELPDCDLALVAVLANRIVGGARSHPRGDIVHLSGVYVHPDCQRSGVGSALLAELLSHYPAGTVVRADVRPSSHSAAAFYTRHGFERIGKSRTNVGGDHWVDIIELQRTS